MFASLKSPTLAFALLCSVCTAHAQEKAWKHGILEAKSDAGFIAMVDKGGFAAKRGLKVELLQIKAGATLMKALISGEIDSVDMGAAESIVAGAWHGRQDRRLYLAWGASGRSGQGGHQDPRGS